jgi:hypothetical protein
MFEVGHNGEPNLTWSGDKIPDHESAIVIGECNRLDLTDYTFRC